MAFKLTPPAQAGEFEEAKRYFSELGIWHEVKQQSVDGIVYCYRWRTKPVSLSESLADVTHDPGDLYPPIAQGEMEEAKHYFQELGLWEEVKHQDNSSLVYCYRWRNAQNK
ncbi:hypothetical protein [Corallincola spongiicola]|uniref:Uncharacterized protein n=1 Tax=Corallincola spongiicola TaxID=2520508 RepID=A0ABY1WQA3_9GAMM|nr:hypothetical protein [Corallincola spongiicola]TAA46773.1 hypothetical protein EXY25_05830 [Corallincola spongiicola]